MANTVIVGSRLTLKIEYIQLTRIFIDVQRAGDLSSSCAAKMVRQGLGYMRMEPLILGCPPYVAQFLDSARRASVDTDSATFPSSSSPVMYTNSATI